MNHSARLKKNLLINVKKLKESSYSIRGIERKSAFIFEDVSMNFFPSTFSAIIKNKEYNDRINKIHTTFNNGTKEMQSSNSSDALLMNIFCNPDVFSWKGLTDLLKIDPKESVLFGWKASFENEKQSHPTEIDMKIGDRIFEAKLTENDFTESELDIVQSYKDFRRIFKSNKLQENGKIISYQLIRNFLVAYKYHYYFTLIVDERRTDLIRHFYNVKEACAIDKLNERVSFITWQEIVSTLGKDLSEYINKKYFYGESYI